MNQKFISTVDFPSSFVHWRLLFFFLLILQSCELRCFFSIIRRLSHCPPSLRLFTGSQLLFSKASHLHAKSVCYLYVLQYLMTADVVTHPPISAADSGRFTSIRTVLGEWKQLFDGCNFIKRKERRFVVSVLTGLVIRCHVVFYI